MMIIARRCVLKKNHPPSLRSTTGITVNCHQSIQKAEYQQEKDNMMFLNFLALLLVSILPKPRHARLRGKDYAFYYEMWQRQAVQWLEWLIKKIDAPETPTALFNKRYAAELEGSVFCQSATRQKGPTEYWQQKASAMAGDITATPGEIFGRLHDQTTKELQPLFQQATEALKKDGL
jgi:hypothetical protein